MYTEILSSIDGIGIFPVVSLLLFVAFFTGVLVWVARADRGELMRRAAMPLDVDGEPGEAVPGARRSA